MIAANHEFQRRGLNALDENGNEGCAFCGRPRDVHPTPAPAVTPGQATYEAYQEGTFRMHSTASWDDLPERERAAWVAADRAAIAARQPQPATWEAWYAADRQGRTMAQDFNESKHDAMRRAYLAGIAARQPQAAPGVTEAQLTTALEGFNVDIDDHGFTAAGVVDNPAVAARGLLARLGSVEPQPAPGDVELLKRAADALAEFGKIAITVEHWLDKPYEDDPRWSPWTRWVERPAREAHNLAMVIRKRLKAVPVEQPAPGLAAAIAETRAELAKARKALGETAALHLTAVAQRDELRELLNEVGVLAANAPEDDSFAVCEEIAMRVAAHGVPDGPQAGAGRTGEPGEGQEPRRGGDPVSTPLMTPGEVAALFKVDVRTVARWGKAGRLLEARTPGGHRRLFPAEVEALLRGESPEVARKLGTEQRDRIAAEAHGA